MQVARSSTHARLAHVKIPRMAAEDSAAGRMVRVYFALERLEGLAYELLE